LVPVSTKDTRSYAEKWNDDVYVKSVVSLSDNNVFVTESFEALKLMRLAADDAKTTEELAGIQKCVKIMRAFVTTPERAFRRIQNKEKIDAINDAEG
jgi:hypothetical protein